MKEIRIDEVVKNKFGLKETLLSSEPEVELFAYTQVPQQEGLSEEDRKKVSQPQVIGGEAARTCYSSKICKPTDYLNLKHKPEVTNEVVTSTRESGHLTTREHVYFTFGLSGISRQLIWSLFHSHPHYNSDQQSQRYVEMKPGFYLVPTIPDEALEIYEETIAKQMKCYKELSDILKEPAEEEYFRIFPTRGKNKDQYRGDIKKKAQEVARYVLPVATHANMYHTVSALTLMRLARACDWYDAPTEAKIVVAKMVNAVAKEVGEDFLTEIPDPLGVEETPEFELLNNTRGEVNFTQVKKFTKEFDKGLVGNTSKLIGHTSNATEVLGRAVRAVIGQTKDNLNDIQAIELILNPERNGLLGEIINVSKMSKLSRALEAVSYTFAKKISHTGDSQDQRHRMTPAARPILAAQYGGEADFITPALINTSPLALDLYGEIMGVAFESVNKLLGGGVPFEKASYLLPNAFSLRFIEEGTLLNLHHKYRMRLCYNAQEEIWNASRDEVEQINYIHPEIGKYLLPPCKIRQSAGIKPFCPEGTRFCGVSVWKLAKVEYSRLI